MADLIQSQPAVRVKLLKNSGAIAHDQTYSPVAKSFTEHVSQSLVVAAGATVTLSLGGLSVVRNALIESTSKITVRVNGQGAGTPLVGSELAWAAFSCSITQLVVVNNSSTFTPTVTYTLTD